MPDESQPAKPQPAGDLPPPIPPQPPNIGAADNEDEPPRGTVRITLPSKPLEIIRLAVPKDPDVR